MLKSYFISAWRNLQKSRFYAVVNIIGLSLGLATSILLLLWVQDEMRFDGFHQHLRQLYHVSAKFGKDASATVWDNTSAPLAVFAKTEIPEVEDVCRITGNYDNSLYTIGDKKFFETGTGLVDSSFFRMFNFPLLKGNRNHPFTNSHSVILSATTARTFFGTVDPMGKQILGDDKKIYVVTGVMKDFPSNSSIDYDMVFNFELLNDHYDGSGYWKHLNEDWGNYNHDTYLLLKPGADPHAVAVKLAAIHKKQQGASDFTNQLSYLVSPMAKMHLYDSSGNERGMTIVRIFFIVAIVVLIIACINYVNLITSRAAKRSKEISIRKIIGAGTGNLFWQFVSESLLLFLISLAVATLLLIAVIPLYNDLSGKSIVFNPLDPAVLAIYGITFLATFLLAGVYPAMTLASFKPLEAMKGKLSGLGSKGQFRKALVVVQFTCSILLIISTMVISQQMRFIREKNVGYDKENVFNLPMRDLGSRYAAARNELLKQPGILDVSAASGDIAQNYSSTGDADWDGKTVAQKSFIINQMAIERNFLSLMHIKLMAGTGFSGTPADSSHFMLNQTAIAQMGLKDPVGKRFTYHDRKGTIVGIVKDFNFQNLRQKIDPLILYYDPSNCRKMYVRTNANGSAAALAAVGKVWKTYNPDFSFEYDFLDAAFDKMYKSDQRVGKIFNYFSIITILISCLGLFGLVTFTAETKFKEIGVRKVLGANVSQIVVMLSKDFLLLVVIAAAIAFPLAWFGLSRFLQGYAYHTQLSWLIFVLAGMITAGIALLTICFRAVQAALANPVKSLRSE